MKISYQRIFQKKTQNFQKAQNTQNDPNMGQDFPNQSNLSRIELEFINSHIPDELKNQTRKGEEMRTDLSPHPSKGEGAITIDPNLDISESNILGELEKL